MKRNAKEAAFWLAVALAGVAGVALVKIATARLPVPPGMKEAVAAI